MTDPETFYQQTYQNLLTLKTRAAGYRNPTRVPTDLLDQIEQYEKALFFDPAAPRRFHWRRRLAQRSQSAFLDSGVRRTCG
ncbi:MAG: hypothetical protein HC875_01955 [Anaerolineales bacterium]|nr:hypothetical protein [Anaerolineales bacterium]